MTIKKKISLLSIPVVVLLLILFGKSLLMQLIFTITFMGYDQQQMTVEYAAFTNRVVEVNTSDISPWSYKELPSLTLDISHKYYYKWSGRKNAPTIVFVHGFNTDASAFLGLSALAEKAHIISYNLPQKTDQYTGSFNDYIAILNDFFTIMNMEKVILAGNSFGGMVAAQYAASGKGIAIDALVLMSTANFGSRKSEQERFYRMADFLLKYNDQQLYYLLMKGKDLFKFLRDKDQSTRTAGDMIRIKNIDWYRQAIKSLRNTSGVTAINDITPVIQLQGDLDRLIKVDDAKEYSKVYKNYTFTVIRSGRHAMVKGKAEEIVSVLEDFLEKNKL